MSVELPRASTEFLRQTAARAVRRSTEPRTVWALGLATVLAVYVLAVLAAGARGAWADLPWLLAPLLAAAGWAHAARRADRRGRLASWVFFGAALAGVGTQLAWSFELALPGSRTIPAAACLVLLVYLLLAGGAWLALGSGRGWGAGAVADALLVLLAGTVAVLRLVVEPVLQSTAGPAALLASLQTLALPPLFLASLLVLRRRSALAHGSAAALLGATLAFVTGGIASLAGATPQPFAVDGGFGYLWLVAWLLMAWSGFGARNIAATAGDMLRDRLAYDRIRRLIVPAAALFLTVSVVDVTLRPGARPETVVAIAMLGAVFSLRTAFVFSLADRELERQRQLAYTRALVAVTHSLAEARDLDATLQVIATSVRTVLDTRASGIELVIEDGATLEIRSVVGLPEDTVGLRFPVRGSFTGWVVQHGQSRATADPATDPYIQPASRRFLGRWPVAAAPIRFRGETTGALFACMRTEPFDAEELDFLGAMAEQAAIAIERARLFDQVSALSVTDPLTGLSNRRILERELDREFAAARRGRDVTAVMFDLDDFKSYNDTHGHLAGDDVLRAFARALEEETRAMNLAARYGGDEFVALLSETGTAGARAFADRVRQSFAERVLALGHGPLEVSAGLGTFDPSMCRPEDLLRAADRDLYCQKPRERV